MVLLHAVSGGTVVTSDNRLASAVLPARGSRHHHYPAGSAPTPPSRYAPASGVILSRPRGCKSGLLQPARRRQALITRIMPRSWSGYCADGAPGGGMGCSVRGQRAGLAYLRAVSA